MLTRYTTAAFSNSGHASSQSGLRRKLVREGWYALIAFFMHLSASARFAVAFIVAL